MHHLHEDRPLGECQRVHQPDGPLAALVAGEGHLDGATGPHSLAVTRCVRGAECTFVDASKRGAIAHTLNAGCERGGGGDS